MDRMVRDFSKDRGPLKKVLGVLREFTHVSTQICVQPGTKNIKYSLENIQSFRDYCITTSSLFNLI